MNPGSPTLNTLAPEKLDGICQRFWRYVDKAPNERGCWHWTGAADRRGYGVISVALQTHRAHRVAWRLFCGPVPENRLVCHTCDVKTCVAPHHLFLGTHLDNMRDARRKGIGVGARNAAKTHCPKGHPYDATNTQYDRKPNGCVGRSCKQCNRLIKRVR